MFAQFSRVAVRPRAKLEFFTEIKARAIADIFRVRDITLIMRGRPMVSAVQTAVQIRAAPDTSLLESGLPLIAFPRGAALMTHIGSHDVLHYNTDIRFCQ